MGFLLNPAAILLGCAALAARPPAAGGLAITIAAGCAGLLAPLPPEPAWRATRRRWTAAAAMGVAAFALARLLARPLVPPATPLALGAVAAAAVAEELFFRRLVYGWLAGACGGAGARHGDAGPPPAPAAFAIVGAAVAFAAVHVPAYGIRVLPLDLAAGLVFGWQRWATGGWTAPALTHAAANVLQLL